MIAGSVAAVISMPFDNAKTKMQKMIADKEGKYPYKNIVHAMLKEAKVNGYAGLWAGLPTYSLRLGPHVMISLLVSEQLKSLLLT